MGGNMEAYADAQANSANRETELLRALNSCGFEYIPAGTVLLIAAPDPIWNEYDTTRRIVVAGRDKKIIFTNSTIKLDEAFDLLKAVGIPVRKVEVES